MSPVSFFMLAASLQRLAVVRFQHLAQPRFRVKHLPSQKYEGQHAVVAVFLQGASADTEQFRHLTVSQVTFPVQRRAVTFQKYRQPFRAFAHICITEAIGSSSIVKTSLVSFIITSDSVGE